MNQKTKIIAAFSISIVFLILVGIFSFVSISEYKESSKWVNHTQMVIAETEQMLSFCQDIETANRGFAITRKENYLVPLNEAESHIPGELHNLREVTKDNPSQLKLVLMLEKEIKNKINFAEKVNNICRIKGPAEAQKLILMDTGQIIMDNIRSQVAEIIDNENELLAERQKKTSNSFGSTIMFIAVGSIFAVLVILFSIYIFVRDFNERLKIQKEIKESEYKIKQFLNALPVGVYILDNEYRPYYANKKAKEILGRDIVEDRKNIAEIYQIYIKDTDTLYPPEKSPVARILQGAVFVNSEDMEIHRGNLRIPLRANASAVKDSEGNTTYAISVFEDITEQRNSERELIRARQLAEESSLLKEVFLANMSHEIRTPMNAIIGFATLLKDTELNADQKEFITNISTASENLLGIINDILDISKIESGHIVLEEIAFNLDKVIKNVIAIMQHKAQEAGIGLNYKIDLRIPDYVTGDPTRLNQVLLNLTNNAVKFTEQGEVNINVELEKETEDEVVLKFSVKDTGIGISAVKLDSIFERFAQADSNTTRIYGGTGLGLSISKSLVELQKGTIGVESTLKTGSVFHFTLTYKKVKQETKKEIEFKPENLKDNNISVKLLLVEDNVLNQKLAMKVLQNFGFEVELAENGKIAVDRLKRSSYDVILMDLQMPEMDGYQATEYIRRELMIDTPIIAMTAHSLVGEKDKCMSIGMNDYIPKPFSPGVLYEKIMRFSASGAEESKTANPVLFSDRVNLSYLRELSGGNEEFEKEMIGLYLSQTPIELEILERANDDKNFAVVKATAHKLKSSFSLMGVNETGILQTLEKQALLKEGTELFGEKIAALKVIFEESKEVLKEG